MTWKEFIIDFLWVVSVDFGFGFLIYILWKYIDLKYFSKLDIEILKKENEWLKKENKKINGTSTEFWTEEDMK